MESSANRELLDSILAQDSIPTIPAFALQVIQVCSDPEAGLPDVAVLVQNDAATSAKLLRLANSAFYGQARDVSSVPSAVSLLGMNTVRMISVATALIGGLEGASAPGFDRKRFWRGSLVASLASRRLAERTQIILGDDAFIAGLLQDVGVCLMHRTLGDRYTHVWDDSRSNPTRLADLERSQFGLTHAEVGSHLLRSWNFPDTLVEAILHHEDSDFLETTASDAALTANLHVSEAYRAVFDTASPAAVKELHQRGARLLGLSEEDATTTMGFVESNLTSLSSALQLDIGEGGVTEARRDATRMLVDFILDTQPEAPAVPEPGDRRSGAGMTVFSVRIDGWADLCQAHGLPAASKALDAGASAINSARRVSDMLLHWSEDEFVVVAPLCSGDGAQTLASRFEEALKRDADKRAIPVTFSIGGAWSRSHEDRSASRMIDQARKLMQAATDNGGDGIRVAELGAGALQPVE